MRDGSRVNLTLGTEVTRKGSTFSIRKFRQDPVSPIDLLKFGSVSPTVLAYFWTLVESHRSILISGGTASGKTTLLNAISMFIRRKDRDRLHRGHARDSHRSRELDPVRRACRIRNVIGCLRRLRGLRVSGGAQTPGSVTLFDLLVAALRQRPEYVIVGEVRGVESFTLFQAISVGHASMSTIHAGSIGELLHRIENEPMNIPRVLFQALDTVAFPAQVAVKGARARRIDLHYRGPRRSTLPRTSSLTNEVFRWEPAEGRFVFTGRSFVLEKIGEVHRTPCRDRFGRDGRARPITWS